MDKPVEVQVRRRIDFFDSLPPSIQTASNIIAGSLINPKVPTSFNDPRWVRALTDLAGMALYENDFREALQLIIDAGLENVCPGLMYGRFQGQVGSMAIIARGRTAHIWITDPSRFPSLEIKPEPGTLLLGVQMKSMTATSQTSGQTPTDTDLCRVVRLRRDPNNFYELLHEGSEMPFAK